MSSVQEEADSGHVKLTDDEKSEEEKTNTNIEQDNDEIASFGTLEEPGDHEHEGESLTPNGAFLLDPGSQILETRGEESENSDLPSHRALERPSSADGSLSIPDDTPSIQVHPRHQTLYITLLTSLGFFSVLSKSKRTSIELWPKSYALFAPIR